MLALIGGSGLNELDDAELVGRHSAETPLGSASTGVAHLRLQHQACLFLARHGHPRRLPPHRINYRANLWALKQAGATQIVAINVVGGIDPSLSPGDLVVPDQLIDYTHDREASFFDGRFRPLQHINFTWPYTASLRHRLLQAGAHCGEAVVAGGVYAAVQGPRFETAAEIARLARDGCTLVGMTGMPEAALARELALPYACLALVLNPAAGTGAPPSRPDETERRRELVKRRARAVIDTLLKESVQESACS